MSEERAKEQLRRMRATAACRFIAAERLRGRDRRNAMLTAIASSFVLFLTVIPLIYHITPLVNSGLTALSFFTSILIIAFSLVQYSNNDAANSEQFHRSGLEINEVCRRFEFGIENSGLKETSEVAESYNSILQKYSINHETSDFDIYRSQRRELYNLSTAERFFIFAKRVCGSVAPYLLLILVFFAFAVVLGSDWLATFLPSPTPLLGPNQ